MIRLLFLLLALGLSVPVAPSAAQADELIAARVARGKKKKKKKPAAEPAAPADSWRPRSNDAVDTYNAAVDAYNAGDIEAALGLLDRVLRTEPGCGMALHLKGTALVEQARPLEAVPFLRKATELHPSHESAWTALTWTLFYAKDFEAARVAGETGLQHVPRSVLLQEELQYALVRLGDYDAALAHLEAHRGRRDHPDLDCLEVLVRVEMEQADRGSELMPECEDGARDTMIDAAKRRLAGEGDGSTAERRLEALGLGGDLNLADAYDAYNAQEFARAIEHLDIALAGSPEDQGLLVLRATSYHFLGDDEAALIDLQAAVALGDDGWLRVTDDGVTGILTARGAAALNETLVDGATLLVVLLAKFGRIDEARARLEGARKAFGNRAQFDGAASRITMVEEGADAGWQRVADLLTSKPDDVDAQAAAADLVFDKPEEAPDAVLELLKASTDPVVLHNVAAGMNNARRFGRCVDFVRLLVAQHDLVLGGSAPPPASRREGQAREEIGAALERAIPMGYGCAVAAKQTRTADTFLARLGGPKVAASDYLLSHAWFAYEAGRTDRALELVAQGDLHNRHPQNAGSLVIHLYTDAQNWTTAISFAERDNADPQAVAYLGAALAIAGRHGDALPLLRKACPALEGEVGDVCRYNLSVVQEHLR